MPVVDEFPSRLREELELAYDEVGRWCGDVLCVELLM
jgi:hypothetical protein